MAADREYIIHTDGAFPAEFEDVLAHLAMSNKGQWLTCSDFTVLQIMFHLGCRRVGYQSQVYPLPEGGSALFWITAAHARALGRVWRSTDAFRLDLTRFEEPGGMDVITEHLAPDVTCGELIVAHRSGDEESPASMAAIARLGHRLGCRRLVVWAAEYEPGSLAALGRTLSELGNETVTDIECRDLTLAEPDDRVGDSEIDAFLAGRRQRAGAERA